MTETITVLSVIILLYIVLQWIVIRAVAFQPCRELTSTPKTFGLESEDVEIPAWQNSVLRGWYVPKSESSKLAIIVPGWGSNASRMIPYAKNLNSLGYSVLLFSSRNQGNSDKTGYSSLYQFTCDIVSAIDFASGQWPESEIMLFGHSMGASATVLAAARDERVKSAVACSAFADPKQIVGQAIKRHKLPAFPFVPVFFKLFTLYYKVKMEQIIPFIQVRNITVPLLLIHGDDDKVISIDDLNKLAENAGKSNTTVSIISGMGHNKLYENDEFNKAIEQFTAVN